jgi:glycosyltransferase involved in cell wall biosynthesis
MNWTDLLLAFMASCTLIQTGLWGYIFTAAALRRRRADLRPALPAPVSVIVCARNEADHLSKNLPLLLAQHYPAPWELLVVNDASTDHSADLLQHFQQKHPTRLRIIQIPEKKQFGKKFALARGIEAAQYEHLLLTDADCAPTGTQWLAEMAAVLHSHPDVEIVTGYSPLRPDPKTGLNEWQRFETAFTATHYLSFAQAGLPYMGVGRNLAYKRSAYVSAGGFTAHAHLASGDDDLLVNAVAHARNTRVCMAPESFMQTGAQPDWPSWFQQKKRHLSAGTVYRPLHRFLLGMLAGSHAGHYFSGMLLLIAGVHLLPVAGLYLLRLSLLWPLFGAFISGQLKEKTLASRFPLFDTGMAIYYAFVALYYVSGIQKNPSWR